MHAFPGLVAGALLVLVAGPSIVDAGPRIVKAGDATASWNGRGTIDDLGDGDIAFAGSITGTMFIRHPQESPRTLIHAAKIQCQTVARIAGDRQEQQRALCVMTAHEGKDVAYAEMRCAGEKDECKGDFTFTFGSGAFRGISGTTPFVAGINVERREAGEMYGYAYWPDLTYSLP